MSHELPPREPWNRFREELTAAGFRPSRRFGQNFLLDEGSLDRIARLAGADRGGHFLEVGVGLGFLTAHLLAGGGRVLGVEVDLRLADLGEAHLRRRLPEAMDSFEMVRSDVLASKSSLAEPVERALREIPSWSLAANLPYTIASPLLALLSLREVPPKSMTVLVQSEVAERLAAGPGEPGFGALSIVVQRAFEARVAFQVGPGSFRPRPKVDSAVVQLERRDPLEGAGRREEVARLVRGLFTQRRKRVRAPLSGWLSCAPAEADQRLEAAGIDREARVEDLDQEAWGRLATEVTP